MSTNINIAGRWSLSSFEITQFSVSSFQINGIKLESHKVCRAKSECSFKRQKKLHSAIVSFKIRHLPRSFQISEVLLMFYPFTLIYNKQKHWITFISKNSFTSSKKNGKDESKKHDKDKLPSAFQKRIPKVQWLQVSPKHFFSSFSTLRVRLTKSSRRKLMQIFSSSFSRFWRIFRFYPHWTINFMTSNY